MEEQIFEKKKTKKGNNAGILLITTILLSLVCSMLGAYIVVSNTPVESVIKNITESSLVETSISSSVDKVYNKTVIIMSYSNDTLKSTGTGFIYKEDNKKAYIMTNNHVIEGADKVKVGFNDGTFVDATIVGGEAYSDIAVLSMDISSSTGVVSIGSSNDIKLGDTIFTVGSPMGKEYIGTVTKGIISGKDRMVGVSHSGNTYDYYMKVLQIDAAVNPGNSGGPLCNVNGEVIGIISLKIVQDEVEGMGFAIPIEDALDYAGKIEKGETIQRPYVGISMVDATETYALWQYRITLPENVNDGVVIIEVVKDSPAEKAKLQKGDVITKLNDKSISSLAEFRYELYKYEVGDKINITYIRNNKETTTSITLGKNK